MSGVLGAWVAEMVLITYRGARRGTSASNPIPHLPLPSEYVATFIIYGALTFVPGRGAPVASAFGWGIVVATLLNLWDPATVGNAGGPAVIGGPSTKTTSGAPVVAPTPGGAQT